MDDGDTDDQKPAPLEQPQLICFIKSHTNMNQAHKWILSSGTCVKDTIFREGNKLSTESLLHSWIIDLDDCENEKLFAVDDWL